MKLLPMMLDKLNKALFPASWKAARRLARDEEYRSLVNSRLFLPFSAVQELARDIPINCLPKSEIYANNLFYGLAHVLKRFSGLPCGYALKATYSHVSFFNIWERDYTGPLPMCLVWGEDTRKKMARMTDKPVVAVGPPIHYAVNAYAPDTITGEKKRLGENALIFPTHSTHLDTVLFDQKHLLSMAHEIKQKFDTVRFCLYWHDVVSGFAKPFLESEFECVTAGHMFDPYFYSRLKALLSVADHSFGNTLGTQSGLSIGMGVPHTIFPQTIRAFSESGEALPTIEEAGLQTCQNLFLGQESVISREQHDFAQQVFGFAFVKKEHEMLALLEQAERMYCAQPR